MAFPRLLNIVLLLTLVFLPPSLFGQTLRVDHVEPPNWWAGMEWNTVQLMFYGENLDGITAISTHEGFKIKTIHQVPNSSYAFIDIELSDAITPGTYTVSIRRGEESLDVPYEIQEREPLDGRNQGFSVDDVVYLITPDRFANGNPQNDHVEGLFADTDRSQDHMRHGGDLEGLIGRLDYLKNLGITAIWLNPVLENNFRNSYHGYAATDLYKIDPRFGSNGDYKRLVKEAQQRGIKVIFDHIANHIGIQHPWLSNLPTDTWLNGSADDHLTGKHYKMDFRDPYADPFSYDVVVGNIDGMAGADLVWVASRRDSNPVHRDLTTGGTPALIVAGDNQNVAQGEGPLKLRLLDVNGDGRKDLLLNHMGTVNRSFIGLALRVANSISVQSSRITRPSRAGANTRFSLETLTAIAVKT